MPPQSKGQQPVIGCLDFEYVQSADAVQKSDARLTKIDQNGKALCWKNT